MHTTIKTILILTCLLFIISGCGTKGTSYCAPNFESSRMSILMTRVTGSINRYEITICQIDRLNSSTFTVYGVYDENDIPGMYLPSKARLSHIEGSSKAGDTFFVDFNSNDRFFIIYEDDSNNEYSDSTELIRGEFR